MVVLIIIIQGVVIAIYAVPVLVIVVILAHKVRPKVIVRLPFNNKQKFDKNSERRYTGFLNYLLHWIFLYRK